MPKRTDIHRVLVIGSGLYLLYARGAFESTQELVLVADDSEGVTVGMDLTFSGFPIGRVRRIDVEGITRQLDQKSLVLISPIGCSVTGESFNLSSEEVARRVAVDLKADKLICFSSTQGVMDRHGEAISELFPEQAEELSMVRQVTRSTRTDMLDVQPLRVVMQPREVQALQRIASELPMDDQVLDYAVRLARATRSWPGLAMGAGPRASIALVRGGRARALLRGGDFVLPDDIKSCALAVLRHRVRLAPELDIEGLSVDQVLQQLLDQVPAPRL